MTTCQHISHDNPALMIPCPECGNDWKWAKVDPRYLRQLQRVAQAASAVNRTISKAHPGAELLNLELESLDTVC